MRMCIIITLFCPTCWRQGFESRPQAARRTRWHRASRSSLKNGHSLAAARASTTLTLSVTRDGDQADAPVASLLLAGCGEPLPTSARAPHSNAARGRGSRGMCGLVHIRSDDSLSAWCWLPPVVHLHAGWLAHDDHHGAAAARPVEAHTAATRAQCESARVRPQTAGPPSPPPAPPVRRIARSPVLVQLTPQSLVRRSSAATAAEVRPAAAGSGSHTQLSASTHTNAS